MSEQFLTFVDRQGNALPIIDDSRLTQHVRQFGGQWAVRINPQWSGSVALRASDGQSLLHLWRYGQDWRLPTKRELENTSLSHVEKASYEESLSSVGEVTAILIDSSGMQVNRSERTLVLSPGNFTEDKYQQLIREIGLMALSAISYTTRSWQAGLGEQDGAPDFGFPWQAGVGLLTTATAILELVEHVKIALPIIERQPLKSFDSVIQPMRADKAVPSARTLVQRTLNPSQRMIAASGRVESLDSRENEFVRYVLMYIQTLASFTADLLRASKPSTIEHTVPMTWKKEVYEFISNEAAVLVNQQNINRKGLYDLFLTKAKELEICSDWAKRQLGKAFWQTVKLVNSLPEATLRLIGTPGYNLIYQTFQKQQGTSHHRLQAIFYLLNTCRLGGVRPTWEIYELWCLSQVYNIFLTGVAGMQPPTSAVTLYDAIGLVNGELIVPKNQAFQLQTKIGTTDLDVAIYYEREMSVKGQNQPRRPDICVDVSVGGRPAKTFLFDVKYRNYAHQGRKQFVDDVFGIANLKYLQELRQKPTSVFILHSDPEVKHDYWGGVPLGQFLQTNLMDTRDEKRYTVTITEKRQQEVTFSNDDYVVHQYGAVRLRPVTVGKSSIQQLRLLLFILQYNFEEFRDYCVFCGCQAVRKEDSSRGQGKGTYCLCPQCGWFWVLHHCLDHHHFLLKLGPYSTHTEAPNANGKWSYLCPKCGSRL